MEPWIKSAGGTGYKLLKTGQTTQYSSELDDGNYQKGQAKSYTVLNTGQYSGTANIDLAHYTAVAGEIAFDNVAKTITDVSSGLAIFKANDVITTDAPNNLGPFTVTTGNVAGTITCTGATFVTETPAGAITIYKREAHSNVCALDNNTKLMWSSTLSGKMGSLASLGRMPWTDQLYDIFAYCAAANAASLAGYTDWRVANFLELLSLADWEAADAMPDGTAFPSYGSETIHTSTTHPNTTTSSRAIHFGNSALNATAKTTEAKVHLVRGP